MTRQFLNRVEAGRLLATQLKKAYANCLDLAVLGLPRGGVPVAFEVAKALNAPLDICLVRKLGVPWQKELAMGAIAPQGVIAINYEIVHQCGISREEIEEVAAVEREELERRECLYRGDRPPLGVAGRTLILVDDGIATGSTLRAAIVALRSQHPAQIVVATPVAPPSTCRELQSVADAVVALMTPDPFVAIGLWYEDFSQVADDEVCRLLDRATQDVIAPSQS
jgi:putative phosphoribosyl transferase